MGYKKGLLYYFNLLILCLFLHIPAKANTLAHCDSLIKKGVDALWKKDFVQSLEYLTEARVLADKNRWYHQLFLANNNIGANYYSMLDYGEALNYYLESYTIAVKHLEPKNEMVVLNNIAILYSKEKNHEKAIEYFKKAHDIAKENKDYMKVAIYSMNLGSAANEMGNLKEAKIYIEESITYLANQPKLLILSKMTLAENALLYGNTKVAREEALKLYNSTDDLEYSDTGISLLFIISKSYLKEGNYALAIENVNKILAQKPNVETKITVFQILADTYSANKQFGLALQFKDSIINTEKKLNEIKNGRLFENSRVKFEIQNYKNEIALNEEKITAERKLFYSILSVIVLVLLFIIWVFRSLYIKNKQKKLIAERNQQIITLELEKEKKDNLLLEKQFKEKETTALLEQERLKSEIESRNRKLSAKALYLSGRNQMIEDIINSLSKNPEIANDTSLSNHIKTLKNHLKKDDEWDSFVTHFEEVNQGLLNKLKLKHPKLTSNDIRFIAYIYMNLSTKEISAMLNITPEACRKRKERIASKMHLTDSTMLYSYISEL